MFLIYQTIRKYHFNTEKHSNLTNILIFKNDQIKYKIVEDRTSPDSAQTRLLYITQKAFQYTQAFQITILIETNISKTIKTNRLESSGAAVVAKQEDDLKITNTTKGTLAKTIKTKLKIQ